MSGDELNSAKNLEEEKSKRRSQRKSKSRYQTQDQQQTKEPTTPLSSPSSSTATSSSKKKTPKKQGGKEEGNTSNNGDSSDKSQEDRPLSQLKSSNKKQSKPSQRGKAQKNMGRTRKPKTDTTPKSTVSSKTEVIEILDDDTDGTVATNETAEPVAVVQKPSSGASSSSGKVENKAALKKKDTVESPLVKLKKIERARKKEFNFVPKLPQNLANPTTLVTVVDSDDESGREIPVYTKEFLEYNKKKENELQQVTKTRRELNHNNMLMKANQDNYDQAMIKQQEILAAKRAEIARKKEALRKKYHKYQVQFQYISLPTNPQLNVMVDPAAYVKELSKILQENDPSKMTFLVLAHARLQGMFNI